ncbi:glutathione peroxidase [Salinisphaera sp. SPP-AMP-43]|uniref:glutathione peroxidase n=1 Tax=Salinisphaera sp. SPP-AMP-43 TaxID=3121288 RepID=UPI003C6E4E76
MSIYEIALTSIDGHPQYLEAYRGQVLLIVNVASRCGFTPQYQGLEALYRRYADAGFAVLGFPCNQFGHQEPGESAEIQRFCTTAYEISFPLFAKIEVNGPNAHPLYRYLRAEQGGLLGDRIKWNFTKFLVGRHGEVRQRYAPTTKPDRLATDIEKALSDGV